MIKWIDEKSVLTIKSKIFKAGDVIPAGVIAPGRLREFEKLGLVEISGAEQPAPVVDEKPKRGRPAKVEQYESEA